MQEQALTGAVHKQKLFLNKYIINVCVILLVMKLKLFLQGVQEGHPLQANHFHLSFPERQQLKAKLKKRY